MYKVCASHKTFCKAPSFWRLLSCLCASYMNVKIKIKNFMWGQRSPDFDHSFLCVFFNGVLNKVNDFTVCCLLGAVFSQNFTSIIVHLMITNMSFVIKNARSFHAWRVLICLAKGFSCNGKNVLLIPASKACYKSFIPYFAQKFLLLKEALYKW